MGVTGFIGALVTVSLLKNGYRVRGTVRLMEKADEFVRLNPELKDKIEFVIVKDISESYALKDVIKDCDYVCQFASPVSVYVADYKTQILDPAVNGILSFLEAAATEPKVKRVIIISTSAATVNFTADPNAGYTYNEKDWNPVSYEEAVNIKDGDIA